MKWTNVKTLKLNIDTSLRGNHLCYDVYLGKKKRLSSIAFSRRGKKEQRDVCLSFIIMVLLLVGFEAIPDFRKKLSNEDKERVCQIFPYIDKYRGMKKFIDQYERENSQYPYEEYDEGFILADQLIRQNDFDNQWHIVWGEMGTLFIGGIWENAGGKKCVAITNGRVLISNKSEEEIEVAELNREISVIDERERKNIATFFTIMYPELQMKSYLEGDGNNIFHLCRATKRNDNTFELLAKAGLSHLADAHLLHEFEELESGTTPSSVFNLPIKLLRYLNSFYSTISMSTKKEREAMLYAYQKYPQLFTDVKPLRVVDIMWINFLQSAKYDRRYSADLLEKLPLRSTLQYLHKIADARKNDYVAFAYYHNYVVGCMKLDTGFYCGRYPVELESAIQNIAEQLGQRSIKDAEHEFVNAVNSSFYQQYMEDLQGENIAFWHQPAEEN